MFPWLTIILPVKLSLQSQPPCVKFVVIHFQNQFVRPAFFLRAKHQLSHGLAKRSGLLSHAIRDAITTRSPSLLSLETQVSSTQAEPASSRRLRRNGYGAGHAAGAVSRQNELWCSPARHDASCCPLDSFQRISFAVFHGFCRLHRFLQSLFSTVRSNGKHSRTPVDHGDWLMTTMRPVNHELLLERITWHSFERPRAHKRFVDRPTDCLPLQKKVEEV